MARHRTEIQEHGIHNESWMDQFFSKPHLLDRAKFRLRLDPLLSPSKKEKKTKTAAGKPAIPFNRLYEPTHQDILVFHDGFNYQTVFYTRYSDLPAEARKLLRRKPPTPED